MTDEQTQSLLLSILAMDAYNQGYDAGLEHGSPKIGSASFSTDSSIKLGENLTKSAGFYAAAYDLAGTTVISYRGKDHPDFSSASDILNGWVIATGEQTGQSGVA